MLFTDIPLVIFIALAFGASGIPLAFWFLRQEKLSVIDKTLIGYTLGWVGVPLIFTLESLVGILYSPPWIFVNWLVVFIAGVALLFKDKVFPNIQERMKGLNLETLKSNAPAIGMLFILALSIWLTLTASGGLLYELDPYFYLDGVHQIITVGHNFANDQTGWYPLTVSNHLGQPLYKYLIAPWFSLYNGQAPYSPYTLAGVGSAYPPLAAGLAVFFIYLFFREMYDERAGILAAGLTAFLPFFLLKFQGGDAQIVPYSIFALFFFLSMLYMALKRESMKLTFLCVLAYGAVVLGSNVDILITFCLSLFFFCMGLRHIQEKDDKGNKQLAIILAGMLLFQVIIAVYSTQNDWKMNLEGILENVGLPAIAFVFPLAMDMCFDRFAPKIKAMERIGAVIGAVIVLILISTYLPFFSQFMSAYEAWGAYTQPLERTIAEQAPGLATYDDTLGFIAMQLTGTGSLGIVTSAIGLFNAIPTIIFNFVFNTTASLLNSVLTFSNGAPANFPIIQRSDTLMTFFFFWGMLLLLVSFVRAAKDNRRWPIYTLLLLAFILPITFMGLEKEKLITYLGITLIFSTVAVFGEVADLLKGRIPDLGVIMWVLVILVLLMELGFPVSPAPAMGGSILLTSFTPTFTQAPQATAARFAESCSTNPALCAVSQNLANITADPVQFFSQDICIYSLDQNASAGIQPALMAGIQYRCSFIPDYWMSSMEWIKDNVPADARIISWWDYGHWINFFGMHDTVLRNEHASSDMIGRTAYAYLDGTATDLRDTMNAYGSQYALMDIEIIGSGTSNQDVSFGGKYSALNYLACAYANQTDVNQEPGQSTCEFDHLWETILVPSQGGTPCTISGNTTGFVAYSEDYSSNSTPPVYCAAVGSINGQQALITYDLNNKTADGSLQLHPARWVLTGNNNNLYQFVAIYDNEQLWTDANGNPISSYAYRTTPFYSSTLYQGFMLGSIPGFDLVYDSPKVKIFRMQDQYYMKTLGIQDQPYIGK